MHDLHLDCLATLSLGVFVDDVKCRARGSRSHACGAVIWRMVFAVAAVADPSGLASVDLDWPNRRVLARAWWDHHQCLRQIDQTLANAHPPANKSG